MNDTRLQQIRELVDAADRIVVDLLDEIDDVDYAKQSRWLHLDNMRGYLRHIYNKTKLLERLL